MEIEKRREAFSSPRLLPSFAGLGIAGGFRTINLFIGFGHCGDCSLVFKELDGFQDLDDFCTGSGLVFPGFGSSYGVGSWFFWIWFFGFFLKKKEVD